MDLKDVYGWMEQQEGSEEIKAFLKEHISSLNNESATRRKDLDELKSQFSEFQKDVKETLTTLTPKEQAQLDQGGDDIPLTKKLANQVQELTQKMEASEKEKQEYSRKVLEGERIDAFKQELESRGVLPDVRNDLARTMASRYSKDEQGDWINQDGIVLSKDVETFLAGKDWLLQNPIREGGGAKPPAERATPRNFAEAKTPLEKMTLVHKKVIGG